MRVRAVAIASEASTQIGSVELATSPHGLEIMYLEAAQITNGQVPIGLPHGSRHMFTWDQVRDARTLGNSVQLILHASPTPAQCLRLVRFSGGDELALRDLRMRRIVLRIFAVGAILLSIVVSVFAVPRLSPGGGPLTTLSVAVLIALLALGLSLAADRRLVSGGHSSSIVRELFVGELLAMLPNVPRDPAPPKPLFDWRSLSLDGLLPRTTFAVSITMAASLLALVVMVRWTLGGNHQEPPRTPTPRVERRAPPPPGTAETPAAAPAEPEAPSAAPSASAAIAPLPIATLNACKCGRADSLLWDEPPLVLSPLVISSRRFAHKNHEDTELELAVINNGERPLGQISLLVEFLEADRSETARTTVVETRAVFFEGPLAPGAAIKWHLEERGTTFRIHPPAVDGVETREHIGALGEGAAPASAFIELLQAKHRPVRLHAAMMLAYLGDDRARSAAMELSEALRDGESSYLARLLEATAHQIVCNRRLTGVGPTRRLEACVVNRTTTPAANLALALRVLDAMPTEVDASLVVPHVVGERSLPLPVALLPQSGQRFALDVDWSDLPALPAALDVGVVPR